MAGKKGGKKGGLFALFRGRQPGKEAEAEKAGGKKGQFPFFGKPKGAKKAGEKGEQPPISGKPAAKKESFLALFGKPAQEKKKGGGKQPGEKRKPAQSALFGKPAEAKGPEEKKEREQSALFGKPAGKRQEGKAGLFSFLSPKPRQKPQPKASFPSALAMKPPRQPAPPEAQQQGEKGQAVQGQPPSLEGQQAPLSAQQAGEGAPLPQQGSGLPARKRQQPKEPHGRKSFLSFFSPAQGRHEPDVRHPMKEFHVPFFSRKQPEKQADAQADKKAELAPAPPRAPPARKKVFRMRVPLLLMPQHQALKAAHVFSGISSRLLRGGMRFFERWLYVLDSDMSATDYLNVTMLNILFYFVLGGALTAALISRVKLKDPVLYVASGALICAIAVGFFCFAYPRWLGNKRVVAIDRDLLFAARHLRIQTTAGVPLFESLVSASHGYGAVSEEIEKIVTKVEAGANMAEALEDSAVRNPSYYYSRILWQMSNAVKAGTDIGPVLSEIVEFLAEEQRIEVRNYGAQLNTLAILYLMACIIVPTVSLIFLMVLSSFVDFPINDTVFTIIIVALIFVQYLFIGMIESRRPVVSI